MRRSSKSRPAFRSVTYLSIASKRINQKRLSVLMKTTISDSLINYYADVLVQTEYGLTWTQIAKFFRRKSAEYKVSVPYVNTIFPSHLPNRRIGFIQNLRVFSPQQQVTLLMELCESNKNSNVAPLKKLLMPASQLPRCLGS